MRAAQIDNDGGRWFPGLRSIRGRTVHEQVGGRSIQWIDQRVRTWVNHTTEQAILAIEHETEIDRPQKFL